VLLGALPVVLTVLVIYRIYADGIAAVDFQHSFWVAGWRVLHGLDPYSWTNSQISGGVSFPYPALVALLLAPFGSVSSLTASIPITAGCVIAAPLSLWILNVRDWRVYGAAALWGPVVVAWQSANFTLPLTVGVALLWRFRERRWVAAALVACLVSIKPIMAPLWIWLLFSRGWRTAALAVAIGIVVNAASWTLLGWHEFGAWLGLLSHQGGLRDSAGFSLIALATHLGLAHQVGEALIILCSCLLIVIAATSARAGRELCVFASSVLLTIVISPQSDVHYFAMLLVPLALTRPRLAWPWLVPLLLWACPATAAHLWQILMWWALLGVLAAVILRTSSSPMGGDPIVATGGRESRTQARNGAGRVLDWAMASARPDLFQKSLSLLHPGHVRSRVSASWRTTSMGSQPIVQDNESTDPFRAHGDMSRPELLSRDGKI